MTWKHKVPGMRFQTKGRGKEPLTGSLEIVIDWKRFYEVMGRKAANNFSRKTRLDCGIIVKWNPES